MEQRGGFYAGISLLAAATLAFEVYLTLPGAGFANEVHRQPRGRRLDIREHDPTIGGDRSSCVFALAETTINLED